MPCPRPRVLTVLVLVTVLAAAGLLSGCATAQESGRSQARPTLPTSSTGPAPTATTITPSTTTSLQISVPGAPSVKVHSPQLVPTLPAQLLLSNTSGPVGTTVSLTATGCPQPNGGYRGFFADSQALGDPQMPSYRHGFPLAASATDTATGTYLVSAVDSPGVGLMEVPCGAATNAVAVFTVSG
jgi:hypothetical protein